MSRTKRVIILISSLAFLAANAAGEVPYEYDSNLTLISEEVSSVEEFVPSRIDSSRIYLKEGAVWLSRSLHSKEPDLKVTVPRESIVKDGELTDGILFNVQTNYSDFIVDYELEIYKGEDKKLIDPIAVLKGDSLSNNKTIIWDGEGSYRLKAGKQLLFRLKVRDEDGNMDKTSIGVIDLVSGRTDYLAEGYTFTDNEKTEFGEAKLVMNNIPLLNGKARITGSHLVDVETITIGEDVYEVKDEAIFGEKYLPIGLHEIPVKILYKDGTEEEQMFVIEIPEEHYFQTGIVDLYLGRNYVSDNEEVLGVDYRFDDDIYDQGRFAYFGQGKFSERLTLTAHIDTRDNKIEDMFQDLYKEDKTTIFERVEGDEERFYPTYGDESYIVREVNTQGKMYLRADYDKSTYLWGDYNTGLTGTEFMQYNRSLYGLKGAYKSRATTINGDNRIELTVFGAEPDLRSAHDEFIGTGGSLYFLKHGDISEGSEKVSVELVDASTGLTKKVVYLTEGEDYEVDDYQGRIILIRPLETVSTENFASVIEDNPRDGYINYLVVDYEYIPETDESLDNLTAGGRAKGWVTDYLAVAGTYIEEEKDGIDYKMKGVDAKLRYSNGTYLTAEYGRSEGTQVDENYVSLDGGLSFDKVENTIRDNDEGDAYRIEGNLDLGDVFDSLELGRFTNVAWYQRKDSEYSYASSDDDNDWKAYGIESRMNISQNIGLTAGYTVDEKTDETGVKETDSVEGYIQGDMVLGEKWDGALEVKYLEELDGTETEDAVLVGAKLQYEVIPGTSIYTKAQTDVSSSDGYDDNTLYTLGGESRINDKLRVSTEYSTGDRGDATELGLDYSVASDYDVYVGYLSEDTDDGESNTITFGQRAGMGNDIDVYQETQFVTENNGKGRTENYGFDYQRNKEHMIGLSFQRGKLEDEDDGTTSRRSISIYQEIETLISKMNNKVEYRKDSGDEEVHQYVTTNSYERKLTEEYTLVSKFNYSRTDNETTDVEESEFIEGNVGLAFRPVYTDRWNWLARYTIFLDEERTDERSISYQDERSHIVEFETLYSYNENLDLGFKTAFKDKREVFERISGDGIRIDTRIYLIGIKGTYHVMHNWDLFGEYHWKVDDYENALEQGAIVAIHRHLGPHFKIGVGYNFSSFSDDLKDDDYDAHGWFINLIGKF